MTDPFFPGIVTLTRKMPCSRTPFRKKSEARNQNIPSSNHLAIKAHLSGSDGTVDASATLAGGKVLLANNGLGLLDDLIGLGEDHLDVAGVGHVGVDLNAKC